MPVHIFIILGKKLLRRIKAIEIQECLIDADKLPILVLPEHGQREILHKIIPEQQPLTGAFRLFSPGTADNAGRHHWRLIIPHGLARHGIILKLLHIGIADQAEIYFILQMRDAHDRMTFPDQRMPAPFYAEYTAEDAIF